MAWKYKIKVLFWLIVLIGVTAFGFFLKTWLAPSADTITNIPPPKPVSLSGRVSVTTDVPDVSPAKLPYSYFLDADDGVRYQLVFPTGDPKLPTGTMIKLTGTQPQEGGPITVQSYTLSGSSSFIPKAYAASDTTSHTLGTKKEGAFVVTFPNYHLTQSAVAQAQKTLFGPGDSSAAWLKAASYGKFTLTGEVTGPYLIPFRGCNESNLAILKDIGVNPDDYDFITIFVPELPCHTSDAYYGDKTTYGELGGKFIIIYAHDLSRLNYIFLHEIGHNLGLNHASSLNPFNEYGNHYDVMGQDNLNQYGAYEKDQLGWLDSTQTVAESGEYTLTPLETSPGNQAIRIPIMGISTQKPVDLNATASDEWLELRTPIGSDATAFPQSSVIVTEAPTQLKDTSSITQLYSSRSFLVSPPLKAGDLYNDRDHGLQITVTDISSLGATVKISLTQRALIRPLSLKTASTAANFIKSDGTPNVTEMARQIMDLTNALRVQNGVYPLSYNASLQQSAQAHADNMAQYNWYNLPNTYGSNAIDWLREIQYPPNTPWGEAIAAGVTSPQAVINQWYTNAATRAQLLNPQLTELGIGISQNANARYGIYYTALYGGRSIPNGAITPFPSGQLTGFITALTPVSPQTEAQNLFNLVNQYRDSQGLPELRWLAADADAAGRWATVTSQQSSPDITNPANATALVALSEAHYRPDTVLVGLSAGDKSADDALDNWLNDAQLKQIITSHNVQYGGIGAVYAPNSTYVRYYVGIFTR